MTMMIEECDMSLNALFAHMQNSGMERIQLNQEDEGILIHTENGTCYSVELIEDKKFIRFSTTLPLRRNASQAHKMAYANRLNREVFLPCFFITPNGNLCVSYLMPYRVGVVAAQFMNILLRFGSMLEYVEEKQNDDGLIDFETSNDESIDANDLAQIDKPQGSLLN